MQGLFSQIGEGREYRSKGVKVVKVVFQQNVYN